MSVVRNIRFLAPCCAVALASAALDASATQIFRVGAESTCEANSIQQAVDLAEASSSEDKVISLSTNLDYSAQAVQISNLDVTIQGGYASCTSNFRQDPPVISGFGASGSVFNIDGTSHVTFSNMEIRDGNASYGGGINFVGNGSLSLDHAVVDFNAATWGGGIDAVGQNGTLDVYLGTETQILRNTATSGGGGIEIAGATYMYAVVPNVLIAFNNAGSGNGGGIETTGDSTVTLGSPGFHGLPLVFLNTAQWGGGVALEGDGNPDHELWLRMFAMDPSAAVAVSSNIAYVAGGGIYIKPDNGLLSNANMCAQDFQINGNVAPEGAAIYLGWTTILSDDIGANAFMNRAIDFYDPPRPCDIESLGATHCAAGVPCNEISDNVTQDGSGTPTPGAVVLLGTTTEFFADRIAMHGNVADNMFKALGNNDFGDPVLELSNCLTGANRFARELIHILNDDNPVTIDQCTFAPDIINSTHVIRFDNSGGNSLHLTNSIVDEPGTLTVYATGGMEVVADYVLTNDGSTLPSPPSVLVGTPDFVDLPNGDYHLAPGSLGIDYAPAAGGVDLDSRPRDVDIPTLPNFFGPRDIGAYEEQLTCARVDTIYCDGFED